MLRKKRKKKPPALELERDVKADFKKLCNIPPFKFWTNASGAFRTASGGFIRYGVGNPGGSDEIGFESVIITPEMVGLRIAVFAVVELKRKKKGRLSPEQLEFLQTVADAGGIAIVADDALTAFDELRRALAERIAANRV